jgi:mannose-6-phosphate isomerase-like protein (cupin superfamily)
VAGVTTEASSRTVAIAETIIPPAPAPPLRIRAQVDEMWFVLEGDLRVKAGRRVFPAPTGSFVFVPKGKSHRFQNLGDAPARILVMTAPTS